MAFIVVWNDKDQRFFYLICRWLIGKTHVSEIEILNLKFQELFGNSFQKERKYL